MDKKYNNTFDVIVVGSGNGGMTAAITAHDQGLKVLLIEKSNLYGGTSATSGGGVWIPNNRYAKALRRAHKIHHKNINKEKGECFGMLWVPLKYFKD